MNLIVVRWLRYLRFAFRVPRLVASHQSQQQRSLPIHDQQSRRQRYDLPAVHKMVILAAAAITAGAVGAYKGGQAAVSGVKNKMTDMKRERELKKERKEFGAKIDQRSKERKERLSRIKSMRSSNNSTGGSTEREGPLARFRKGGGGDGSAS